MLTSNFEEIRMLEDESFYEFYAKLNDIVNFMFNLGDKVDDAGIVRKILWSLPKRFRLKVTAIEESKDLDTIHVEFTLPKQRKGKSISLKSSREKYDFSSYDDLNNKDIALTVKKFRKFMFKKSNIDKGKKINDFVKINESERFKCFECSKYSHLRNECPNFKRNKGKALNVTLSDES